VKIEQLKNRMSSHFCDPTTDEVISCILVWFRISKDGGKVMAETRQAKVSDGGSVSIVYGMSYASGMVVIGKQDIYHTCWLNPDCARPDN
jgi:hypothetical protein